MEKILILFLFLLTMKWTTEAKLESIRDSNSQENMSLNLKAVMSFVNQRSKNNKVLVLRDDPLIELQTAISSSASSFKSVTIFDYEAGKIKLYLFEEERYVHFDIFVTGSSKMKLNIFKEVKNESLESRDLQWIITTSDKKLKYSLQPIIREGVQVIVFEGEFTRKTSFTIFISAWQQDNKMKFVNSGWVNIVDGEIRNFYLMNGMLIVPLENTYSNFKGRVLKSAANSGKTFMHFRSPAKGIPKRYEGVDYEILQALKKKYNFELEFIPGEGWGGLRPDGTITGMIGKVARHEAHMAMHEISITASRESVMDFSSSYITDFCVMISKAPSLKYEGLATVAAFTPMVWSVMFASVIFMAIIFSLLVYTHHEILVPKTDLRNSLSSQLIHLIPNHFYNNICLLVNQGKCLEFKSESFKVMFSMWMLYRLILWALYGGTLVASFTAPPYEKPINSLMDFVEVNRRTGLYPILTKDTSLHKSIKAAPTGTSFYYVNKTIIPKSHSVKTSNFRNAYLKAVAGEGVVMSTFISSAIYAYSVQRQRVHYAKEVFSSQLYGMAMPSGAPYRDTFSNSLQQLVEGGLMDKWLKQALRNELYYQGTTNVNPDYLLSLQMKEATFGRNTFAIGLTQLVAPFVLLGVGYVVCFWIFILENLYFRITSHMN